MKFYPEKFKVVRKQKKLTAEEVAIRMGVNRRTVSTWETGKIIPNESRVRMLAKVIGVSVDVISDSKKEQQVSHIQFSNIVNSWLEVATVKSTEDSSKFDILISGIANIKKSYSEANIIINALLNSISSVFYLKDTNQKYITANKEFLKNLSLKEKYSVLNKTDRDFFAVKEAQKNSEEDERVIRTGEKIINKECYIPGSRMKKWGLISKIPVYDEKGCIQGVIGSFVDITERKKTEEVRELLEANLDIVEEAILVIAQNRNRTRQLIYANKVNEKIYEISLDELNSSKGFEKWLSCIHPDFLQNEIKYNREFSWPAKRLFKIITLSGVEKWIEAFCHKYERKNKQYFFFAERDITESMDRKNFIDGLDEAICQSDEVIWSGSYTGSTDDEIVKFKYLSESTEKVLGIKISDLKKNSFKWIEKVIDEDKISIEDWFRKKKNGEILCRITSTNSKIKWVQLKRVMKENNFYMFINDITLSISELTNYK